jgi:hypothetical protein
MFAFSSINTGKAVGSGELFDQAMGEDWDEKVKPFKQFLHRVFCELCIFHETQSNMWSHPCLAQEVGEKHTLWLEDHETQCTKNNQTHGAAKPNDITGGDDKNEDGHVQDVSQV